MLWEAKSFVIVRVAACFIFGKRMFLLVRG
jgi:hypothetical protein